MFVFVVKGGEKKAIDYFQTIFAEYEQALWEMNGIRQLPK